MATLSLRPSGLPLVPADLISCGAAARLIGCSTQTVRDYSNRGILPAYRLSSGHRRFSKGQVLQWINTGSVEATTAKVLIYARVSTNSQSKEKNGASDLSRQRDRLIKFSEEKYYGAEIIEFIETGSSMNFTRRKLGQMLEGILGGKYDGATLCCEYRDRICRYGIELVEMICQAHGVNIVYVEQQDMTDEQMLMSDLTSIVFLFGIRSYAKRASERRRKELSISTIQRGNELYDSGFTTPQVIEKLHSEGHAITEWQCKRYIKRSREQIDKLIPNKGVSSTQEYYQLSQPGEETDRLPYNSLYEHYAKWAKEHAKPILSKKSLFAVFNCGFKTGFHGNYGRCYKGLRIKGAKLHVSVKRYILKAQSPTDGLLTFTDQLKGKTLVGSAIMEKYREFVRKTGLGKPLGRKTVENVLTTLGARKTRKNGDWLFSFSG